VANGRGLTAVGLSGGDEGGKSGQVMGVVANIPILCYIQESNETEGFYANLQIQNF
jgi:hypothetical protein